MKARILGPLEVVVEGERIVDVDPSTVAVDGPVYDRPVAYPTWIDALQADAAENLPRSNDPEVLREQFLIADVGITGANFLIAETGSSIIVWSTPWVLYRYESRVKLMVSGA
mgnify:CR=1 FL=1